MSVSRPILLEKLDDATGYGRYAFEPETGSYRLERLPTHADAMRGCVGFAEEQRLAPWRRHKEFVALYVEERVPVLWVQGRAFNWGDDAFEARSRHVAPYRFHFTVERNGTTLVSIQYWYFTDHGYPGPDATDVFRNVAGKLAGPGAITRFVNWTSARASGRDVMDPEFVSEVDRAVVAAERRGTWKPDQSGS